MLREIKGYLTDIPARCIGQLNTVKMAILLKLIYRFNTIPITIPARFVVEMDKPILNFIWKGKGSKIVKKTTLKKKNRI